MKALPRKVITLDMDATLEDPWHCCGGPRSEKAKKGNCWHIREDTVSHVEQLQLADPEIGLVVLSYRLGKWQLEDTQKWLEAAGLVVSHVFLPDSPDTKVITKNVDAVREYGQVGHKHSVVRALQQKGVQVVASFDDNDQVCKMFKQRGVPLVVQVPYLCKPERHEYFAGYLGAPKPDPAAVAAATAKHRDFYDDEPETVATGSYGLWDDDYEWMHDLPISKPNRRHREAGTSRWGSAADEYLGRLGKRWEKVPVRKDDDEG